MKTVRGIKSGYSIILIVASFAMYMFDVYPLGPNTRLSFVLGDIPMFAFVFAVSICFFYDINEQYDNVANVWTWGRPAIATAIYCLAIEFARVDVSVWNLIPFTKFLIFYVYQIVILIDFATGVWLHYKTYMLKR